jgi:hypothetical protein
MRSIRSPLAAWLAIFSLLLNGFTPLVAHAVTNAQPAAMPICNASGNTTPDALQQKPIYTVPTAPFAMRMRTTRRSCMHGRRCLPISRLTE